jgi:hypothetical protein
MEMTVKQFDDLKITLALKYVQIKALENEVEFLKGKFKAALRFRDENEWSGKTDFATFKMQEGFRLSYPGNADIDKKREFYTFMQKKDTPWYQQAISLNWNSLNSYANEEIETLGKKGQTWEPWPHCALNEEIKFDMRARPGVLAKLYDPAVIAMGFQG